MRKFLAMVPFWYLLIIPAILIWFGSALNVIVMGLNHAQMPVLPPGGECTIPILFWITKGGHDIYHVCMSSNTHLAFLTDWMVGEDGGISSIGDLLISIGQSTLYPAWFVWAYLIIEELNARRAQL